MGSVLRKLSPDDDEKEYHVHNRATGNRNPYDAYISRQAVLRARIAQEEATVPCHVPPTENRTTYVGIAPKPAFQQDKILYGRNNFSERTTTRTGTTMVSRHAPPTESGTTYAGIASKPALPQDKILRSRNDFSEKMTSNKVAAMINPINQVRNNIQIDAVPVNEVQIINDSEDEAITKQTNFRGTTNDDISRAILKAKSSYTPWKDEVVIAQELGVSIYIAKNVLSLLKEGCTIPFIVRYRKNMIGDLDVDEIREIEEGYEKLKKVHKKVETILKTVRHEKFDYKAAIALLNAKTMNEVDLVYAPFKPESKKTLAEVARQLGLEPLAIQLFNLGTSLLTVNLSNYLKLGKGLESEKDVLNGVQHIIADILAKSRKVLDFVQEQSEHDDIVICSDQSAEAKEKDKLAEEEGLVPETSKYENYFQFSISLGNIAPHHVLALNRGEKQSILTVKVKISEKIKKIIVDFCWGTFFSTKALDAKTSTFLKACIKDSYKRQIEPYLCRLIRSNLTDVAVKESISMFGGNVKSLLLTQPVRGKNIVGVDPGFFHGCKLAVVSPKGEVLSTDVIYPHSNRNTYAMDEKKLRNMILNYDAEYVAVGNGTACRETETWISDLRASGYFLPCDAKYCIINESGVSIWSVTKEAEEELPYLEPNLRSAVSIARRLQDPLLEYAKVMPKHLGVGMYQHDVPEDQLSKCFDNVFEECASFVGVDLNVCPKDLLSKVSGLSKEKAAAIVDWRERNGAFICRDDLLAILDSKTYQQCAGFVKIIPETCLDDENEMMLTQSDFNPLDKTIIHPESYSVAERFLRKLKASPEEIGCQSLINKVTRCMMYESEEDLAREMNVQTPVMQLIIQAFEQLQDYDIREEFDQPLFMTAVRSFSDLKIDQELTGRICNLTGFGAFVDIGVGRDGLIHTSQMRGQTVNVGDKVTVRVGNIDHDRKRISLKLCSW